MKVRIGGAGMRSDEWEMWVEHLMNGSRVRAERFIDSKHHGETIHIYDP